MKTTPYPFQIEGVQAIEAFGGRALVGDSMGLGKSLQSLLWAVKHPEARPIVVVCFATLKWNWEKEAKIHVGMRAAVLSGRKPWKHKLLNRHKLFVINYDILHYWLGFFEKLQPQLVIIDESQALANPSTLRCRAVFDLCKQVPYVICLSGTPLTNNPVELWPTLHLLRPERFPSRRKFAWTYTIPRRTFWGWEFKQPRRLGRLHRILKKTVMIRRLKEDVLKDLPPKIHSVVPLPIDNPAEYKEATEEFLRWLQKNFPKGKAHKAARAVALTKLGYLLRLTAKLKLTSVIKWIDTFWQQTDDKLVMFGVHHSILHTLKDHYPSISVVVDGGVVGRDRQVAIDQFNKYNKTRLFIGNLKAAGVGWNCTASSSVAFCEFGWTPGALVQAADRIHGLKRGLVGKPANIYYLPAKGTVEEKVCALLQDKYEIISRTLDGTVNGRDFNLFDLLCEELANEEINNENCDLDYRTKERVRFHQNDLRLQ